jgi:hypothetical protein
MPAGLCSVAVESQPCYQEVRLWPAGAVSAVTGILLPAQEGCRGLIETETCCRSMYRKHAGEGGWAAGPPRRSDRDAAPRASLRDGFEIWKRKETTSRAVNQWRWRGHRGGQVERGERNRGCCKHGRSGAAREVLLSGVMGHPRYSHPLTSFPGENRDESPSICFSTLWAEWRLS